MTLSLAAVFIPVLFLGGLIGRLFQAFAVTIGVAILVSGFVSLTLTPMLCSRWLEPPRGGEAARALLQGDRAGLGESLSWYERSLAWVVDRRGLALAFSALDPGRHRGACPGRAQGLHPERRPAAAFGHHRDRRRHQLRRDGEAPARGRRDRPGGPQRGRLHVRGGGGGRTGTIDQGRLIIHLKPRGERSISADERRVRRPPPAERVGRIRAARDVAGAVARSDPLGAAQHLLGVATVGQSAGSGPVRRRSDPGRLAGDLSRQCPAQRPGRRGSLLRRRDAARPRRPERILAPELDAASYARRPTSSARASCRTWSFRPGSCAEGVAARFITARRHVHGGRANAARGRAGGR